MCIMLPNSWASEVLLLLLLLLCESIALRSINTARLVSRESSWSETGAWVCESPKLCRDHVGAGIIGVDLERGGGGVVAVVVDKDLVAEEEGLLLPRKYR
jgi:hypothetical protein